MLVTILFYNYFFLTFKLFILIAEILRSLNLKMSILLSFHHGVYFSILKKNTTVNIKVTGLYYDMHFPLGSVVVIVW